MTSMSIFQFECLGPSSPCQKLVAHTDTEYRFASVHCLAQMFLGDSAEFRIAGTIGNEESVVVHISEIIIPRDSDNCNVSLNEAAQDIVFDTAIHQNDLFVSCLVCDRLLATYNCNLILLIRISDRKTFFNAFRYDHSKHRAILPQCLSQRPGVNAVDSWDFLFLEPFIQ